MRKRIIPMWPVIMAACLATTVLAFSQSGKNPAGKKTSCPAGSMVECGGGSSIALVLGSTNTITVCPGRAVSVCATSSNIFGSIITHTTNTDCSITTTTNSAGAAGEGAKWWEASGLVTASGDGLCASFNVPITNKGSGTITFHIDYCNSGVCTNCGTSSVSIDYKVVECKIQITPASQSALINGCTNYPSPVFCLANSCPGSGINWSIAPAGLTGGATLTPAIDGDCVTVNIGDVETNYTITATSADNTNCLGSASLGVKRDCECDHHIPDISHPMQRGGNCPHGGTGWIVETQKLPCGERLRLSCTNSPAYPPPAGMTAANYVRFEIIDKVGSVKLIGHCPYDNSCWDAKYNKCICGAVIRSATFQVVNSGTSSYPGKNEQWFCGSFIRSYFWVSPNQTPGYDLCQGLLKPWATIPRQATNTDSCAPDDPIP